MKVLSILSNIDGKGKFLYDSVTNKMIMNGTEKDMEFWKDAIETAEQNKSNRTHFLKLKEEYTQRLISAGNSEEEVTIFLKEKMPFLYENTTP